MKKFSWVWPILFGLVGFAAGCEVHVQRALLGIPATPVLLAVGGALLGTIIGGIGRREKHEVGSSARSDARRVLRALLLLGVVLLLAMSGIGLLMFFWPGLFRRDERADKRGPEDATRNLKTVLTFRALGGLRQLEANPVVETFRDRGVFLVRDAIPADIIIALRAACAHCGRTLNWLESEKKFKCPQCGSGYRMSGEHFEGPARRSLERLGIRLAGDGDLAIDPERRFQKELGQWQDAESFVRP